ncbi:hypothetical protein ACFLSQ_05095 [Bacteroidota bacterium]
MKSVIKKIKKNVIVPGFITLILLFNSCNEEPTNMGYTLLQDTITIYPISTNDTSLITGVGSYRHYLNTINRGIIHIGKFNEYEAISLLRFTEPVKGTDSLDFLVDYTTDEIISCKISMPVNRYALGDSLNPGALSFTLYKIVDYWSNLTTWDSLFTGNLIDMTKPVGEFNGDIEQKDTIPNIEFDFDKELALEWIKDWYRYKNGDTINNIVWGIAFKPNDNSSVIRQFAGPAIGGQENTTKLTLIYLDSSGVEDTLEMVSAIDKPFYKTPEFNPEELIVEGGATIRGLMYFDVSMIPPVSAIHSAQLELTLDMEKNLFGNFGLDSTILAELPADNDSASFKEEKFIRSYYAERTEDKFYFTSITSAIETWNRKDGKGLIVFHPDGSQNEYRELDKMTFYGLNAPDSAKLPKLTIIYSTRPKFDSK